MKTTVNVHLVPTDEDSSILLTQNKLYWTGDNTEPPNNSAKNQHLYFTLPQSNLEISKIKDRYMYIDLQGKAMFTCNDLNSDDLDEKLVASTDKNDNVSSIPQSFIEHYISEYNKGNVIRSVEIELNTLNKDYNKVEDAPYQEIEILKLTSDNEVFITLLEEKTYSYEEMCSNMQQYLDEYVWTKSKYITPQNWLRKNLHP
jgi:hypothetical protein